MHPSSFRYLTAAMTMLLDAAPVGVPEPAPLPAPVPRRPSRHLTPDEEKEILDRADELNARIARILAEADG